MLILDRAQIHGYVKNISFVDCFQKRWDLHESSCAFKSPVLTIKLSMTEKGQWRLNLREAMKYFSKNPLLETIIPAPDTNELEKDVLGKKKETAESVRLVKSIQQSDIPSPSKPEMKSEGGGETNISQLPTMLVANFWSQETRGSSSKVDVQEYVKDKEHPTDWISDICDNEILAADPFKLLVVLLIVSICTDTSSL